MDLRGSKTHARRRTAITAVRARVRAGRLELPEGLPFPEGAEVTVTLIPPLVRATKPLTLETWDLGVMEPLTRAQIYEDVC